MIRTRTTLLVAGLLAANGAAAQTPGATGESVLTLRVDGELSIDPDGKVKEYQITTKLDPQVDKLVRRAVVAWRFKPILVDGRPAIATSPMRITLAAVEREQGYQVKVDNVVFRPNTQAQYKAEQASQRAHQRISVAGEAPQPRVWITSRSLKPPQYPAGLMRSGVEGIVLLNVRLNPDGTVAEVFASQSSLLNVKGRPALLDRARVMLERSASDAAKRWSFDVVNEEVAPLSAEALTVRVPVEYKMGAPGAEQEALAGKWRHEFRGPNLPLPWLRGPDVAKVGVSDFAGNEILAGTSRFALSDKGIIGKAL